MYLNLNFPEQTFFKMLRSTRSLFLKQTSLCRPCLTQTLLWKERKQLDIELVPHVKPGEYITLMPPEDQPRLAKMRDLAAYQMVYKDVSYDNQPQALANAGYRTMGVYPGDLQDYIANLEKNYKENIAEKRTDPKFVFKISWRSFFYSLCFLIVYIQLENFWVRKLDSVIYEEPVRNYFSEILHWLAGDIQIRNTIHQSEIEEIILEGNYTIKNFEFFGSPEKGSVYILCEHRPSLAECDSAYKTTDVGYLVNDVNRTTLLINLIDIQKKLNQKLKNGETGSAPTALNSLPVDVYHEYKNSYQNCEYLNLLKTQGSEYGWTEQNHEKLIEYLCSISGFYHNTCRYFSRDSNQFLRNSIVYFGFFIPHMLIV